MENRNWTDIFSLAAFSKLKLGKGLGAKCVQAVMLLMLIVGGVLVLTADPMVKLFGLIFLIVAVYMLIDRILQFATDDPTTAVLEGGEIIKMKSLEMAAQGSGRVLPSANVAPPQSISTQVDSPSTPTVTYEFSYEEKKSDE